MAFPYAYLLLTEALIAEFLPLSERKTTEGNIATPGYPDPSEECELLSLILRHEFRKEKVTTTIYVIALS